MSDGPGERPSGAGDRFDRQRLLPGFADAGLPRLRDARIHVVGAGPAAAAALLHLARAGVGTLYVDDGADVAPSDAGAWLYQPGQVGQPRVLAALEALRAASSTVEVRPAATETSATAVLVCPQVDWVARTAAGRARLAGLPHVIALGGGDGDGGEVLAVPLGAPCFDCANRPGARVELRGGAAAALGTLAALELLLLLAGLAPGQEGGRRIVLAGGQPRVEATVRRPGCGCRRH